MTDARFGNHPHNASCSMPASALQKCRDEEERHLRRLTTYRKYRRKWVRSHVAGLPLTICAVISKNVANKADNIWRASMRLRQIHSDKNIGMLKEYTENSMTYYGSRPLIHSAVT
jgi:hypothetical protein